MRYDAVISLIALTYTADTLGQETAVKASRAVYANEFALGSAEFYDAGRSGLKPERQYQIRTMEYAGERLMSVDGIEYNIIRTGRRGEWTLITCERVAGND